MMIGLGACGDNSLTKPKPSGQAVRDYLDSGNPCDGPCDLGGSQSMALRYDSTYSTQYPLWSGQVDAISAAYVCPPFVPNAIVFASITRDDGTPGTTQFTIPVMVPVVPSGPPPGFPPGIMNGRWCSWPL